MTRDAQRRYRLEWALLALALTLLGALIANWIVAEREQIETIEGDRLTVQARVIEENLARQLEGVNQALHGIPEDLVSWEGGKMRVQASRRLTVLSDVMPGVRTLLIADASGKVIDTNRRELIGLDISARSMFARARQRPDPDTLYVSPPFQSVLGPWVFGMSRTILGPDGNFAGVVSAVLDPDYFFDLLNSVLYAPDMWASLTHEDGVVFVFAPHNPEVIGKNLAQAGSFYTRHRQSGARASLLTGRAFATGDERMIAQRNLRRSDLHMDKSIGIGVSRELDAMYQPWRKLALEYAFFYALIVLAAVSALLYAQRRRRGADVEAAAREKTDQLLRHFFNLPFVGMAVTAPASGDWLHFNDTLCDALRYRREELAQQTWEQLIHPDDRAQDRALRARMLRGEIEGYVLEQRFLRKDDTEVLMSVDVKCTRKGGADVEYVIAMLQDISERRRAEAERAQLEAQLRESQKMEALGTLAGGVAHDFNNIVAAMMGNVELAARDVEPDHPVRESLEEIRKASLRAKNLVRQILAFGRRQLMERQVIRLAPVVEDSARLLRSTVPVAMQLEVRCASDAPRVLADATQIQQVLLNLCTNARQAMEGQKQPARIEIALSRHEASAAPYDGPERRSGGGRVSLHPGAYACLSVSDTGPGMDAATRSRIFEPFFTTKPVGKGTGLGLAVVHGIVQEHDGSIAVQTAPGAGTTFRIYLPATSEAEDVRPQDEAGAAQPAAAARQGAGKSILYVDDDEAIVFLMTRLLEREGYRVASFVDAQAAIDAVRADPHAFDLAVTDYNMPSITGLDVARQLRAIRADLPVALATGYITEDLKQEAPAAGVSELIHKPNTVDELCAAIARLASGRPR